MAPTVSSWNRLRLKGQKTSLYIYTHGWPPTIPNDLPMTLDELQLGEYLPAWGPPGSWTPSVMAKVALHLEEGLGASALGRLSGVSTSRLLGAQKWAHFPTSPLAVCSSSTWVVLFGPRIIITCLFLCNPHPEAWWQSYPGAIVIYYMFSWLILWVFWPRDIFLAHFLLPAHFKSTYLWFFTNV